MPGKEASGQREEPLRVGTPGPGTVERVRGKCWLETEREMRSPLPGTGHVNRNYGDLGERGYGRSGPPLSGRIHLNSYIMCMNLCDLGLAQGGPSDRH